MKMTTIGYVAVVLFMVGYEDAVHAAGTSPSDAAAPGTVVAGIVECGDGYTSHELYDVKLTVLELLRGDVAWQRIAAVSPDPGAGQDYILVRIKFEYYARGRPGDCEHTVKPEHFTAWSSNGTAYTTPTLALPEPSLRGLLRSEQSLEGWIAVQVAQDNAKPLLTFSVDDTGAVQHGGKLWFQLYH